MEKIVIFLIWVPTDKEAEKSFSQRNIQAKPIVNLINKIQTFEIKSDPLIPSYIIEEVQEIKSGVSCHDMLKPYVEQMNNKLPAAVAFQMAKKITDLNSLKNVRGFLNDQLSKLEAIEKMVLQIKNSKALYRSDKQRVDKGYTNDLKKFQELSAGVVTFEQWPMPEFPVSLDNEDRPTLIAYRIKRVIGKISRWNEKKPEIQKLINYILQHHNIDQEEQERLQNVLDSINDTTIIQNGDTMFTLRVQLMRTYWISHKELVDLLQS